MGTLQKLMRGPKSENTRLNNENAVLQKKIQDIELRNQLKQPGRLLGGNRGSCGCESPKSVLKIIGECYSKSYTNLIEMWRANVLWNWSKCAKHGNVHSRIYSALN